MEAKPLPLCCHAPGALNNQRGLDKVESECYNPDSMTKTEADLSESSEGSAGSVPVTLAVETPDFMTSVLDLKKLLRDLSKHSKTAIEKLAVLIASQDERIALSAVRTLLEMQTQIAKDINTDQLQRLIAQVKLNGGVKRLLPVDKEDEEQDDRPTVDFTNIRVVK